MPSSTSGKNLCSSATITAEWEAAAGKWTRLTPSLYRLRLARGRCVDLVYASAAGAAAATRAQTRVPRNDATTRTIVAGQPSCPKSNAAAVRGEPLVDSAAKSILERAQPARVNRGGGGRHRAHAPNRAQARGGSSACSGAGKCDRGTRVQCAGNNGRHRLRRSGKAMRPARMRKAMMLRARVSAAELADWSIGPAPRTPCDV